MLLVAGMVATLTGAQAVLISNPLSLDTQFLVGILNGQPGDSNVATETVYAQTILDLAFGEKTGPAGQEGVYEANTTFNYSGTITSNGGQVGGTSIEAGWDWALAKYDGQNGGYVLFALLGQASTIPQYPYGLWTDNTSQFAISHLTLFDGGGSPPPPPPPPPPVPEGGPGILLLGALLLTLGGVKVLVSRRALA